MFDPEETQECAVVMLVEGDSPETDLDSALTVAFLMTFGVWL